MTNSDLKSFATIVKEVVDKSLDQRLGLKSGETLDRKLGLKPGQTLGDIFATKEYLSSKFATKADLTAQTEELKKYTQQYVSEGVDAVVGALDEMVANDVEPRVSRLEKIHPEGKHIFTN